MSSLDPNWALLVLIIVVGLGVFFVCDWWDNSGDP